MGYKYFDEGLNGETGKSIDKRFKNQENAFLRQMFQYPLREEQANPDDEVEIPAHPFHIVKIDLREIYNDGECEQFEHLLTEIPDDMHVIFEMTDVKFMSTDASFLMINLYNRLRAHAKRLFLISSQKSVLEKLATTKLNTLIAVRSTVREAYEEIQNLAA